MSDFFGGGSTTTNVNSQVDPSQQRLNDLYFSEALGLRGATGGIQTFGTPQPGLFSLQPSEEGLRRNLINLTTGLAGPGGPHEQILGDLYSQGGRASDFAGESLGYARGPVAGQVDLEGINSLRGLLAGYLEGPTGLENEALGLMRGRSDPSAFTAAAERYMREIGEPTARAASVAGGMGGIRGGAFGEGLARESARLALPIAELMSRYQGEEAGARRGISDALEGRRAGTAASLFGIGSGLEGRGLARRQFASQAARSSGDLMQGLGSILPLIDQSRLNLLKEAVSQGSIPRLLSLQDFLRQQDLVSSTLLKTPVKTGTIKTTTENEAVTLKDFLGPVSAAAAEWMKTR